MRREVSWHSADGPTNKRSVRGFQHVDPDLLDPAICRLLDATHVSRDVRRMITPWRALNDTCRHGLDEY